MASSSTNPFQVPANQNNKSDQLTGTSDESKNVLSTSSPVVESTVTNKSFIPAQRYKLEQQDDLSPHLIEKCSSVPLAAPCLARTARAAGFVPQSSEILQSRPFEEIAMPGASSGSTTKTKNDGSS